MLRDRRFKATYGGLEDEDSLARPPKGFAPDTPHIDAIKNRHFFGGAEFNLAKRPPRDLPRDDRRVFPRSAAPHDLAARSPWARRRDERPRFLLSAAA